MCITAINKAHQNLVNKAYKFYRAYHELVNLDGTFSTEKEQGANERKQEKHFEKYNDIYSELPKREQVNFDKKHHEKHGY